MRLGCREGRGVPVIFQALHLVWMALVDGEKISQYVVVPKAIAPDGVATQKSATNIQRPQLQYVAAMYKPDFGKDSA